MGNDDILLRVDNLIVHYEMDDSVVEAVNNISLELRRGETTGLIGETGAGKTTVALTIMGLLPEKRANIISGSILFEGEDLLKKSSKEMQKIRGKKISMIFQDPMTALNPVQKIGPQIAEILAIHGDKNAVKTPEEQALDLLSVVGIPAQRFNDYAFEFSGGMKQRVVIAIALACQPELVIADEPTTALDVTIQAQVLDLMKNLKREFNTSMLLITHDFGVVAESCERCAVMYAGEIIESGTVEDIFDNPKHPYTIGLFGALPNAHGEKTELKPVKGLMPDPANLPEYCSFADRCEECSEVCRSSDPKAQEVSPGHFVKCFLSGADAKEER